MGAKLFDLKKQPVVPIDIGIEIIEQACLLLCENQKSLSKTQI
ncbi:hypothetical protein [Mucilaginibacter antarcticus]